MKKLPRKVIRANAKERLEEEFQNLQERLQEASAKLSTLRNVKFESVEQFEAISDKWLKEEIAKSKENLNTVFGGGGFIPEGIARQFATEYDRVRKECKEPINTIVSILSNCKQRGIGIKIDSKGRPWLNEKHIKEAVEREAAFSFSDEQMEYYEHFQAIFEAMDALRRYERENGFEEANLQGIMADRFLQCYKVDINTLKTHTRPFQYTPEEFCNLIGWGSICRKKGQK